MHTYATDSDRGRMAIVILTVASVLLAWGLNRTLTAADLTPPWWLDTPAVLGFFGLLWKVYDRYAWRWRWGAAWMSDVPDLAGQWDGEIRSSYNDISVPATLYVHQTATHMLIELVTDGSRSASVMATLNCQPGLFQGLSYVYENRPRTLNEMGMTPHSGRVHLRLEDAGNSLAGDYEADRSRGTTGRIAFRRQQGTRVS